MIKLKNIDTSFKNWIRAQSSAFGMAGGSRILFVDTVLGSDSYTGLDDPAKPKKTIESALAAANAQDVIYIAPGGAMSGGDPVAYRKSGSNHLITAAKYGLAMVGLTHSGLIGFPMDPQIKIASGVGTPIITCYAPYCAFENLALNTGGSNSYPALAFENGETATSNANNISIFNCYFRNAGGTGATGNTGGAIFITGGMGFSIKHCAFLNCRHGISAKSGTEVCEGLFIEDVAFFATSTDLISADIYLYFQGQNYTNINKVRICHDRPSYSGGHTVSIISAGASDVGMISDVTMVDADGTVNASSGTAIRVPITMGVGMIYNGDNALCSPN